MSASTLRIALVGNPNCGKTALFNLLTGGRQKVANYAGVTVERKEGRFVTPSGRVLQLLDLPGTYSFDANSPDEQITRDVCEGNYPGEAAPDLIVCVADATNLRLHLRFVLEVKRLGRPVVLALNMMDAAKRRGIVIDVAGLQQRLGVPVVETVAVKRGRKVGVPQGTSGEMILRLALGKAGMSITDIQVVPMDPSTIVAAFASKQIDGAGFRYPLIDVLKKRVPDLKELADDQQFYPKTSFINTFVARNEIVPVVVSIVLLGVSNVPVAMMTGLLPSETWISTGPFACAARTRSRSDSGRVNTMAIGRSWVIERMPVCVATSASGLHSVILRRMW